MSASFQPTPIPWTQFPFECLVYVYPVMVVLHLAVFIVGSIVILFLHRRRAGTLGRRIGRFALFVTLLLVVGAFFNGLWSCLIWDRLYDSTDYFFDFSPFWPITRAAIDAPWGDERGCLLGVSLFQLQLIWFIFAAGTWTVTIVLYRLFCRRPPPNNALQQTPGGAPVSNLHLSSGVAELWLG